MLRRFRSASKATTSGSRPSRRAASTRTWCGSPRWRSASSVSRSGASCSAVRLRCWRSTSGARPRSWSTPPPRPPGAAKRADLFAAGRHVAAAAPVPSIRPPGRIRARSIACLPVEVGHGPQRWENGIQDDREGKWWGRREAGRKTSGIHSVANGSVNSLVRGYASPSSHQDRPNSCQQAVLGENRVSLVLQRGRSPLQDQRTGKWAPPGGSFGKRWRNTPGNAESTAAWAGRDPDRAPSFRNTLYPNENLPISACRPGSWIQPPISSTAAPVTAPWARSRRARGASSNG